VLKIASLDDAFSEFFGLGASEKKLISKREKEKAEKTLTLTLTENPRNIYYYC